MRKLHLAIVAIVAFTFVPAVSVAQQQSLQVQLPDPPIGAVYPLEGIAEIFGIPTNRQVSIQELEARGFTCGLTLGATERLWNVHREDGYLMYEQLGPDTPICRNGKGQLIKEDCSNQLLPTQQLVHVIVGGHGSDSNSSQSLNAIAFGRRSLAIGVNGFGNEVHIDSGLICPECVGAITSAAGNDEDKDSSPPAFFRGGLDPFWLLIIGLVLILGMAWLMGWFAFKRSSTTGTSGTGASTPPPGSGVAP